MMQVKRYMAPTFAEALIQAKNELGTDAVIVESKKIRVGGIFGFFGREMTELTVALDTKPGQRPPSGGRVPHPAPQPRPETPPAANAPKSRPDAPPAAPAGNPAPAAPAAVRPDEGRPAADSGIRNLEQEMVNLRVAVSRLLERDGAAAAGDLDQPG